jgi:cobyrinic acid a,c-diamide synthase
MPQGKVTEVPDDGLTTAERRVQPVLAVHTGDGKGKSTAAFGMALRAWAAGWPIGVFQFTKSPKWRVGEEDALVALGRVHAETGQGAPVTWHRMGAGWSWLRTPPEDHARAAVEGWQQVRRDLAAQTYRLLILDEFTYPLANGTLDPGEVLAVLAARPGIQHVVITGRRAVPALVGAADLVTDGRGAQGPARHRMVNLPRVVIAATRSGDGKTTVATGVMAALRASGLRVSPHKVGPDYIDPSYHAAACGVPGRNLDPWLSGEELVAPLLLHGAARAGAGVAVIEGVMGLFDGAAGRGDFASTAHVARLTGSPVVLVVGAAGASRSVAATVHGFASWDPSVRLAGVVLNQVSSDRHEAVLREALEPLGVPVLGALRRDDALHLPSRHLGLVPAGERPAPVDAWLPVLRALVQRDLDLDRLLRIARSAPDLPAEPWTAGSAGPASLPPGRPPRVAVASGPAFTFGYAEHPELLAAAGAEVAPFDPLVQQALPSGTDALVAGGGFPQVHADGLAANIALLDEVRRRTGDGMPVVAECAGLLWLGESLDGRKQCAVVPAHARMTGKLTLGYREAEALRDTPLVPAGTRVRAHEFHRTVSEPVTGADPAWRLADGTETGWAGPSVLASYLHLHWAGLPGAATRLARTALARRPRVDDHDSGG